MAYIATVLDDKNMEFRNFDEVAAYLWSEGGHNFIKIVDPQGNNVSKAAAKAAIEDCATYCLEREISPKADWFEYPAFFTKCHIFHPQSAVEELMGVIQSEYEHDGFYGVHPDNPCGWRRA